MTPTATHCVRRLRFHGSIASQRLARHRVEVALANGADAWHLGKETILCVRRLAISLPRIEHLADALDTEVVDAARPARGFVPAKANAVLFADRAELLACLARDWCVGETANRWWWPVLFRRNDFAALVRRAWLEDARPVPAALSRLEAAGLATRFLAKLSPVDLATLWRNMIHAFHLSALDAAWKQDGWPAAERLPQTLAGRSPPWPPWVEPEPSLAPEAARIFVTALLLERAPGVVRSLSFAYEIRAWSTAAETAFIEHSLTPRGKQTTPNENLPGFVKRSPGPFSKARPPPARSAGVDLEVSDVAMPPAQSPVISPANAEPDRSSIPGNEEENLPRLAPFPEPTTATRQIADAEEPSALLSSPPRHRIVTDCGGVFYLVNVAIALEFYGDFTTPAQPGLALPLWDFLALIGEWMIGDEFAEDPLAVLFAELSGRREDEPPGAHFEPPTSEPLPAWLDRICHDIEERLTASLSVTDRDELRALVLNHQAKIEADSLRVDVHFSLASHPIELRIAGLDRDPGWVPAAGRSIYFHYD